MKVILYIGHHKVGSTALQTFLSQNSHRLLQHGILYPYVERQGAMMAFAKRFMFGDRFGSGPINVREAHNALAFRMLSERVNPQPFPKYHRHIPSTDQILHSIQKQIKRHDPQTVILCAEAFSNLGPMLPEQIDRLRNAFPTAEFEIYLVLRRPDEYIVAWQSQRLIFGAKIPSLTATDNEYNRHGIHFNYYALLEPWLQRIPNARLILRPYSEVIRNGGSSADFTQQCGADFPDGLLPASPQNPSIPNAVMEIARLANQQLAKTTARDVVRDLRRISSHINLPKNAEIEMFGQDNRTRILEYFEPIHAYLNTISGSSSFFPDYAEITQCKPIPEATALRDALIQLNAGLLARVTNADTASFILDLRHQQQIQAA